MTCTDFDALAREWARDIEDREARRSGSPLHLARVAVARRLGVSPGTLENLRSGRLKQVAAHVFARLRAGLMSEITAEIHALEHKMQIALAAGVDPRSAQMAEVVAALATARAILEGEA